MSRIKLIFRFAFDDLKKQKLRTFLGVFGVMISIGLLAVVLFLADSISVSFIDYLSIDAGNQDMVITTRHYNGEPENRSSYFEYNDVINTIEDITDEIGDYIPRFEVHGQVNVSESFDTNELTNMQESTLIAGINFSLENEIEFGYFTVPNTENEIYDVNKLKINRCAIYYGFSNLIKYKEGDDIELTITIHHGDKTIQKTVVWKVDFVFDFYMKWPSDYRKENLIVVDVETLYSLFGYDDFKGRCSKLILTFANGNDYYDVRDIEGTERRVKEIAAEINIALGLEEWNVDLPKLDILGYSEYLSMGITVIFVFVSIIGMLISGILINGILKTSVEEKIREFGIYRTLGGYKRNNLSIVILQGFLLCNFGTLLGIAIAYFGTQYILIPFAEGYLLGGTDIGATLGFSATWVSFLIAYSMGIGVGLIVSVSPALKVMRLQLIESIHPYRHEDTLYHLQKKATVNYKLIIVGIILAANGGFIYFVIPRLLVSMNFSLMAGTFIAILMIFLIGLTLAGLGLMPVVLRATIALFKPAAKRLHNVVKIFVFRYQRRNSSTIIMFAMSFSFVIFASTVIQTQSAQVGVLIRLRYGSDLVIETAGWAEYSDWEDEYGSGGFGGGDGEGDGFFGLESGTTSSEINYKSPPLYTIQQSSDYFSLDPNRIMTTDFAQEILNIDGVEKVSTIIASPWQLTQIYSDENKIFSAELADYAGLSSIDITLLGIDEEYPATVDAKYIVFTRGDMETAFDTMFANDSSYYCVISEGIAVGLDLEIGDKVRMTIRRGDEYENYVFRIIGMASSMPGFPFEFGSSRYSADDGGVLISQEVYLDILDIPEPAWVDRIFIKVQEKMLDDAEKIEDEIDERYLDNYDYYLFNLERMVERQQQAFAVMDVFFMLILMTTVIICLFGLLSSSYSTILERKKEIGIVRTLGLKGKEINRMFIIEALIIMIASGTVGVLVGWITGWLLASNLNLFTDMPYQPLFPIVNLLILYGLSISFIVIGMHFLLRKARKQKIVEIYREAL